MIYDGQGVKAFQKSHFKGLSVPYASPELLQQYVSQSETSPVLISAPACADTYAFGVSCYEILTRVEAWPHVRNEDELIHAVLAGVRPQWPETILRVRDRHETIGMLVNITEKCWFQNGLLRPNMGEIYRELQQRQNKRESYSKP